MFLRRIVTLLGILVCEAWLLWPRENWKLEWPPVIALISFFAAYLGVEGHNYHREKKAGEKPSDKDIELYNKLVTLLPTDPIVKFYREHDFLGSFEPRYFDPLATFVDTWDTPECEFIDKELECAKQELFRCAQDLGMKMALNTTLNRAGRHAVKDDYSPGPIPEWTKQRAQEISQLVPAFVECHETFVRLGRKKLFS